MNPATPEPTPQDMEDAAVALDSGRPTKAVASAIARARHAGEVAERERIVKLAEQWKSSYGDEDFIAAIRSLAPDTEAEK
jgi:hypothetical protein